MNLQGSDAEPTESAVVDGVALGSPPVSPPSQDLTEQTLTGLVWQFAGAAVELVVRIAVMIVLAHLLAPAEFGVASAASVVLSVTQIFAQLGVGQAVVQRRDLTDADIRAGFAFSIWSGLACAALIGLGAPAIAALFRMPPLRPVIAFLSVAFLLTGPSIVASALMQRRRQYRVIAAVDAASFILGYATVGVTLALLHFGLWSLILAQLSQVAVRGVTYLVISPHPKSLVPRLTSLRRLLQTGSGYSLGQIGNFLALNGDNFAVGRWMGAADLGLYSRAYQFLSIPSNLFGTVVDKVLFPAMAHVQGDPVRLSRAYKRSLAAIALITLPASAAMVVLAPELIRVVLGAKWAGTTLPFQILAAALMFRTSYKMSDSIARATGAVFRRAWRQWIYAGVVVCGAVLGSRYGLSGVAVGVDAAIVLNFLLMLQLSIQIADVSWGDVLLIHLRQVVVVAPAAGLVWLSVGVLRQLGSPPAVRLLAGLAVEGLLLGASFLFARGIYGPEGRWVIELAEARLIRRFKPVSSRERKGGAIRRAQA